ncbi:hypothetical protein [Pseudomonas sp. OA65]|nr:hypothetical protein [Pseudomonas sp. OA65]
MRNTVGATTTLISRSTASVGETSQRWRSALKPGMQVPLAVG